MIEATSSPDPGRRYGARPGLRVRSWGEATDVAYVPDASLTLLVDAGASWLALELSRFPAGSTASQLHSAIAGDTDTSDLEAPAVTIDDLAAQLERLCDYGLAVQLSE